jgi:hypothetical protein
MKPIIETTNKNRANEPTVLEIRLSAMHTIIKRIPTVEATNIQLRELNRLTEVSLPIDAVHRCTNLYFIALNSNAECSASLG